MGIQKIYAGSATGAKEVKKLYAADPDGKSTLIWEPKTPRTGIYGAEWAGGAYTKWIRTNDAALFQDPVAAVNNGDGYSPFDDLMPWAGMVREQRTGGVMVKIPKYWYKWTLDGVKLKLQISDHAETGFFVSPAHADRGDGSGERDVVYVGAYHCASDYKSKTGVLPIEKITRATARTNIHNLGSTIWQYDYAMLVTIWMLYLVEYADWNSQAVIGYGCGNGSSVENNGLTDAMVFHTGTSAASRTTYGHIRYRYIEGLWDNVYDWCDGIYFNGADIYVILKPSQYSDTTGGTNIGTRATTGGYTTAFDFSAISGFEWFMYPSAIGGNGSDYISDYCFYGASGVVLYVGGSCSQDQVHGLFCLNGDYAASHSYAYVGSRLQELPSAA